MSTVTRHRPKTNGPARPTNAGGSCPTPIGVAETATLTQLKAAAAEGDPQSWAELVRRFTSLLWSIARSHRLNEADAADVVQNTWLRLLENLGRIDQPEALPGWLATTARREALNVLRRHTRDTPVDEQYFHTVDADAPELDLHLLIHERDTHLWTCFQQLPQRDQQLLRACIASDRPCYTAIAKDLNMPIGSIGPTRMRALKRLRILLEASTYTFHATTTQSTCSRR
jgi:RNA polymerase sigma factor (sigma-70 family)